MPTNPQRIGPQRLRGFCHFALYFWFKYLKTVPLGWCHTDHLEGPSNCIYSNLITAGRASEGRIFQDLYYMCCRQSFNLLNQWRNGENKATSEFGNHFTVFFPPFLFFYLGEIGRLKETFSFPQLFAFVFIILLHAYIISI